MSASAPAMVAEHVHEHALHAYIHNRCFGDDSIAAILFACLKFKLLLVPPVPGHHKFHPEAILESNRRVDPIGRLPVLSAAAAFTAD